MCTQDSRRWSQIVNVAWLSVDLSPRRLEKGECTQPSVIDWNERYCRDIADSGSEGALVTGLRL